nr:hypothetical protein CFP56_04287 [Quercus suber]
MPNLLILLRRPPSSSLSSSFLFLRLTYCHQPQSAEMRLSGLNLDWGFVLQRAGARKSSCSNNGNACIAKQWDLYGVAGNTGRGTLLILMTVDTLC